ncbi:uncharacterized protein FPRO_10654 [Fusarium proliferatum ET1]|uniref:Uncharacterized protein n=1 Tax=Fusarium proliferatum (strain ET1) TaxID=1227346 RepID=A0A1L7VN86_FUSPR|nr:uncharacterized protein FPRO_10654 [Fusarium proliferatum ET1]CZR41065.1 uncharacterized protein FPRO_10654 [Fusarium proliferatum ET1]
MSPHGASSLLALSVKAACHFAISSSLVIPQLAQADLELCIIFSGRLTALNEILGGFNINYTTASHPEDHGHITGR